MTLADRLSASAARLVDHFAYASTLRLIKQTGGTPTATRGVTVATTAATVRCSTPTPYGAALRDGDRILDGDFRVYLWAQDSALTFAPAPGMVVELDGDSYRVVDVQKLAGAWELHLRGGGS